LFDFYITTPQHYQAQCNGLLQSHSINLDSTENWYWHFNQPIVSYLASVAVAPYTTVHQAFQSVSGANIPVELTALPADTTTMKNFMSKLHQAFNTFENKLYPYQWDKVGYVLVPFNSGAMEHASNIAFGKPFISNIAYESIYPHELSHHWFGDLITCDNAGDMWLNEGWATYCENIFYENVYSRNRYITEMKDKHLTAISSAHINDLGYRAVANMRDDLTYGTTVYYKGADMIHTLRTYMGDSLFFHSLQKYFVRHKWKNSNTLQFRDSLIAYSGMNNLTNYFDDWILQSGFPHFSISAWNASGSGNSTINMSIMQRQSHATHAYHHVPVSVTFFNQQMQSFTQNLFVDNDGCNDFNFTIPLQNPITAIFDYDEMLSDAVTDDVAIIKTTGAKTFTNAKCSINTSNISDSAMVWAEHHWIRPEGFKTPHAGLHLADRYFKLDGIWDNNNFTSNVTFPYNGSTISSTVYDKSFFGNQSEDSLVLLYRLDETQDWQIDSNATINFQGSHTNKTGTITTDLKHGEFTFGMYDNTWNDTANAAFGSYNCYLTNVEHIANDNSKLMLYPNPTSNQLSVIGHQLTVNTKVEVFDLLCRKIELPILFPTTDNCQLNTVGLPSGLYFITCRFENGSSCQQKFVITK
jgi:aminopeptidase N